MTYFLGIWHPFLTEYYFMLSQAYKGITRYNGICLGDDCWSRIGNLDYIWREFEIPQFKKYCCKSKIRLLDKSEFQEDEMALFSATYFADTEKVKTVGKSGGWYTSNLKKWNMMLFFNSVSKLEALSS